MGVLREAELLEGSLYLCLEGIHGDSWRYVYVGRVIGPIVIGQDHILIISRLGGGCPKAGLIIFLYFLESIEIPFSLPILLCRGYPYLLGFVSSLVVESSKLDYLCLPDRRLVFTMKSTLKAAKTWESIIG